MKIKIDHHGREKQLMSIVAVVQHMMTQGDIKYRFIRTGEMFTEWTLADRQIQKVTIFENQYSTDNLLADCLKFYFKDRLIDKRDETKNLFTF